MKGWRSAWRTLTLKARLNGLRFHDLRHQAITELCERGLSDMTIMRIAGHVSRDMLEHYSHIRLGRQAESAGKTGRTDCGRSPAIRGGPDHQLKGLCRKVRHKRGFGGEKDWASY